MLISHKHKFIYTKTKKTASTTVAAFFTQYCTERENLKQVDSIDEHHDSHGIIGRRVRGKHTSPNKFDVNTNISEIKKYLGEKNFNDYFKFTVIRNPFDRFISIYSFAKNLEKKLRKRIVDPRWGFGFDFQNYNNDIECFRSWAKIFKDKKENYLCDTKMFMIDKELVMDFYIRYENLEDDIQTVCKHVDIKFNPDDISNFKRQYRQAGDYKRYYTDKEIEIAQKVFSKELSLFKYQFS